MHKHLLPLASAFLAGLALASCATPGAVTAPAGSAALPAAQSSFSPNPVNRQLGYQLLTPSGEVVFYLDAASHGVGAGAKAYVQGSFNGWAKGNDPQWEMQPLADGSGFSLRKPSALLKAPGNSGFPEFKFYVKPEGGAPVLEPNAISTIPGFQMATNNLLLLPGDDPAYVAANLPLAAAAKPLSAFDLADPEQRAAISNVRLVPGTKALYRGYHPFKMSRAQFDTESTRSQLVKEALAERGIASTIVLSGEEKPSASESVSAYHQAIIDAGRQLVCNTSYNVVYYQSAGPEFGGLIQKVVRFINGQPGPYYVHCRLGTDRTGAVSAYLAALCGAGWDQIAADYQRSNAMMIREFRDYHLLQYSFERMLGKPLSQVPDLQAAVAAWFVERGYLEEREIAELRQRLGAS